MTQNIELLKPGFALTGALMSYVGGLIGASSMPDAASMFEQGALIGIIIFMSAGIVAMWKSQRQDRDRMIKQVEDLIEKLQKKDEALAKVNEEIRTNHREQATQMIKALDRVNKSLSKE